MAWTAPNVFVNGTTADAAQVNANFSSLAADTEFAYSTYKQVLERIGDFSSATAQTVLLGFEYDITGSAVSGLAAGNVFYLDPADYAVTGRTTKYRIRAACLTNATAPAITFTVGLYPVSAVAGGAAVVTATLGSVTAGSTVAFASQAASTRGQNNSGDFTAPTAGYYTLGVLISGTQATNSKVQIDAALQVRQV